MSGQWKFQLLPSKEDSLGEDTGYRMDRIAEDIECEINDALPYRFKFHKIGKIVISLGPNEDEPDYAEYMGVSIKLYENFDPKTYMTSSDHDKQQILRFIICEVFNWFLNNFDDSEFFVNKVKEKVSWVH